MPAVEADADHGVRRASLAARLDEDPAQLRAVHHQVVGPFERRLRDAERAQRARQGDAGDERQARHLAHRALQAARERKRDACARRAVPAPAAAPAARGLLLGREQHRAGTGTFQ